MLCKWCAVHNNQNVSQNQPLHNNSIDFKYIYWHENHVHQVCIQTESHCEQEATFANQTTNKLTYTRKKNWIYLIIVRWIWLSLIVLKRENFNQIGSKKSTRKKEKNKQPPELMTPHLLVFRCLGIVHRCIDAIIWCDGGDTWWAFCLQRGCILYASFAFDRFARGYFSSLIDCSWCCVYCLFTLKTYSLKSHSPHSVSPCSRDTSTHASHLQ